MSTFNTSLAHSHATKMVMYNLLNNKRFFFSVVDKLDTRFFKGCYEVQTLIEFIVTHYNESGDQIGKNMLLAKIDAKLMGTSGYTDLINYLALINDVNEISDTNSLTELLVSMVKRNLLLNQSMEVAKIIKNPNDSGLNNIINEFSEIMSISFAEGQYDNFMPETAEELLEALKDDRIRIPFKVKLLNESTDGGVMRGTLNTIIGGTGAGKTLTMLSLMIDYLELGFNCAYMSLELGKNMIRPRYWANVLDIPLTDLNNFKFSKVTDEEVISRFNNPFKVVRGKSTLKVSEPNSFSARDIERYIIGYEKIHDVQIDVVFIDHLSLMPTYGGFKDQSMASKYGQTQAEEAITMAKRLDVACWTGAQFNRGSMSGTDGDMTGIAGSIGVTHASDLVISIHADQETGALLFKKHKCRYSDVSLHNRGYIGIDRAKQRLYDYDGRKYDMTEFDAKYEEKKRSDDSNAYINDEVFEKIINNESINPDDLKKLVDDVNSGGDGTGIFINTKINNPEPQKKEPAPLILSFN